MSNSISFLYSDLRFITGVITVKSKISVNKVDVLTGCLLVKGYSSSSSILCYGLELGFGFGHSTHQQRVGRRELAARQAVWT